MNWFNWKYILIIIAVVAIVYAIYLYRECKKNGKQSSRFFTCGMFSSEPKFLNASDEYYKVKEGKCYRYTDFGNTMSVREVDFNYCNE